MKKLESAEFDSLGGVEGERQGGTGTNIYLIVDCLDILLSVLSQCPIRPQHNLWLVMIGFQIRNCGSQETRERVKSTSS